MKSYDTISNGASILTSMYALADIESVISIIILVISLLNILLNSFIKLKKHIKEKNIEAINNDLKETKEDLEKLTKEGKQNE